MNKIICFVLLLFFAVLDAKTIHKAGIIDVEKQFAATDNETLIISDMNDVFFTHDDYVWIHPDGRQLVKDIFEKYLRSASTREVGDLWGII